MNAPFASPPDAIAPSDLPANPVTPEAAFAARCEAYAQLHTSGELSLHDAIDDLQACAEATGLIDQIGQDEVQRIMGVAFAAVDLLPGPDQDELEAACEQEIMLRTADMVRQWELADPRDRWRHTDGPRPTSHPEPPAREPYSVPQSTIDAFRYVLRRGDPDYLAAWLADHPLDAPALFKIWKASRC
jgi:hypothetical protein